MSRLDAMVAREYEDRDGNKKTSWTRIGTAFPARSGVGYTILLDALPLPDKDGRCAIMLFEPKPRDGEERQQRHSEPSGPPLNDALDDDIPFAPMRD